MKSNIPSNYGSKDAVEDQEFLYMGAATELEVEGGTPVQKQLWKGQLEDSGGIQSHPSAAVTQLFQMRQVLLPSFDRREI